MAYAVSPAFVFSRSVATGTSLFSYERRTAATRVDFRAGVRQISISDVAFPSDTVRGKYWRGVGLIEIGTNPDDFPGFQAGVVLAHELGHGFYDIWSPDSGIEEYPQLFRTTDEMEQAVALSERLHGPMVETDGPFVDYRKGSDEELAAAVFASRIIEPTAAQRIAPDAVHRLEEVFGDLSDDLF